MLELANQTLPVSTANGKNDSGKLSATDKVSTEHQYAGRHYIVDFWEGQNFDCVDAVESALIKAAKIAGACLLHTHLHKFSDGGGVTGVALLAESHISIHTWPEHGYAALDVFMCGESNPEKAVELLRQAFQPGRVKVNEILRGRITPPRATD